MIPIAKPMICQEEIDAANRALRSGRLAQGPEVEAFEQAFAEYIGVDHAVAVSNGTVALSFAMIAAGLKDKRVHTTSFSFVSSATSILIAQARPFFHDIDPGTYHMVPPYSHARGFREGVWPKDGVVLVHLYGAPAELPSDRAELRVIEDCAQSIGSEIAGRKVGSLGVAGAFSFYATKNMTTAGEGGMVTTNNHSIADRIRLLRNHGDVWKYQHATLGTNARMTEVQAAVGRVQLRKLDEYNAARRRNAQYYDTHIDLPGIITPEGSSGHTYHQYVLRVCRDAPVSRSGFVEYLRNHGIQCGVHYPTIIPAQPLFGIPDLSEYPNAIRASESVVSIPVGPWVSDEDREYIVGVINGIAP
jgi:perosamine synthetase